MGFLGSKKERNVSHEKGKMRGKEEGFSYGKDEEDRRSKRTWAGREL